DDILFSTIKVVSRHQNTQQYGSILPIELTTEDIRNIKAYKEYYACATGEAAPKPKASGRRKRSDSDTSITPPTATPTPITTVAAAPRLTDVAKGKQPAKAKKDTKSGGGNEEETESDEESAEEETREEEEESFDLIPRTPKDCKDYGNGEEDQGLRVSEEQRLIREEEADELYQDVDINQGRRLQVSQDIKDSHVTLTLVHPDGQQESSSVSSFVTSMLNPTSDAGLESIFTTASSSVAPLPTPIPTMTPSIITTITTASHPPIPPTPIPSEVLQNLPTFDSVFHFNERLKSLETSFSEYRQTNPFAEAVLNIPDKTILQSYGETAILKRRRENDDDQEGPSAGSNRGSKRRREGEEPVQTTCQMDEPSHPVFETGAEDQPIVQTSQHPEWFSQLRKPPTPDRNWNKTLPAVQGSAQTWISELAKQANSRSSFNELLDTPIDFSNFIMNRLCVDTLTPELLARPTYELMRGSCNSLTELEYHLEEVYKATTDQLDWVNPEGQQYPHNLLQPLPLIPNNQGRRIIPFAYFINNDLEYLRGGASSQKYTTSMTKTKAVDYGHIKWIEDLVPRTMFAVNRESALDVYSKRRIIAITDLKIVEWHNYKHLDWISVRRDDDKIYKFKEGCLQGVSLSNGVWKIFNWESKATRRGSTLPSQTQLVFDGAFGGVRDEEVVVEEGVVVTSSSLEMLTNSCLGGIMVNLIFLEGLEEEALVEFMV
nr:hypothetical protein [Tanacetum cinerariifolium]